MRRIHLYILEGSFIGGAFFLAKVTKVSSVPALTAGVVGQTVLLLLNFNAWEKGFEELNPVGRAIKEKTGYGGMIVFFFFAHLVVILAGFASPFISRFFLAFTALNLAYDVLQVVL